jgi:hypothetical protein
MVLYFENEMWTIHEIFSVENQLKFNIKNYVYIM